VTTEDLIEALIGPVSYIGKSVGLCSSVKESMRTDGRWAMAADLGDLKIKTSG